MSTASSNGSGQRAESREQSSPSPFALRPSSVPWSPLWGIVYAVVVFFASQVAAGLVVSIYPLLHHWSGSRSTDWLNDSVVAQFVFVLLAESMLVGAIYLWLRRYKSNFLLLGLRKFRASDIWYGFRTWAGYLLVFLVITAAITRLFPHFDINQQQQIGFTGVHGTLPLTLTFISLVLLPPIAEEIVMRGFLYGSLRKFAKPLWAALLTSIIFASAHLPEGGAAGPLWIGAIDTFILSLFLCRAREVTGGLWAGITAHALKNGVAFVALFILNVH